MRGKATGQPVREDLSYLIHHGIVTSCIRTLLYLKTRSGEITITNLLCKVKSSREMHETGVDHEVL